MSSGSRGSHPVRRLASQSIGQIVDFVQNYAAVERERVGAANAPPLAVLQQRLDFLYERYQRLLEEARAFVDPCHQGNGWLAQAGHLSVAALLNGAGSAFALMTVQPFNLGRAALLFSLGLAILVPYVVDRFLERFRSAWVEKMVVLAALVSGVMALVSFAEVRGDVLAHYLNSSAAVVVDGGGQEEPSPSGGDGKQVFALLRQAMVSAALAFELAAGLAFFAFREARRNNDQGRRDRVEKELNRTVNEILEASREVHELTAQPSREHAEFCQQLQHDVLESINRVRNGGLGVVIVAALWSAATMQAADLHIIAGIDLSQTSAVGYNGRSELEQNRQAIAAVLSRLPAGASITIIGITDQTYVNPHVLLSAELTADPGYFGSRLNEGRRQLVAEWQKRSNSLTASFKATDILGALRYAGEVLARSAAKRKVLAIFSDGRNCTAELDLESPRVIVVGPALTRVRKHGPINSLTGVDVFLFGAGDHSGKRSTSYTVGLKDFWEAYVKEAGGSLLVFSTTREPRGLQLLTVAGGNSP